MQKRVIKETDSKADFWHHHVMTTSARMCVYITILSLKVDQKQVCEQSLYVEKI